MHLAAASPNFLILEQMEAECPLRDEFCAAPVRYQDGFLELPIGPGLGTDLRLDLLEGRGFPSQPMIGSSESWWR